MAKVYTRIRFAFFFFKLPLKLPVCHKLLSRGLPRQHFPGLNPVYCPTLRVRDCVAMSYSPSRKIRDVELNLNDCTGIGVQDCVILPGGINNNDLRRQMT